MGPIRTAAALVILLTSSGCRLGEQAEVRQVPPELTMEGVHFWIDRDGATRASGQADRITLRRDTTEVAADRMTLLMTSAEGEVRLAAPVVTGVVSERRFVASGGVTAERGDDRAETAAATYEPPPAGTLGAGTVHGSDPVVATGPGYRLDGSHGFTLDPASGEIVLGGGARLVSGLPVHR